MAESSTTPTKNGHESADGNAAEQGLSNTVTHGEKSKSESPGNKRDHDDNDTKPVTPAKKKKKTPPKSKARASSEEAENEVKIEAPETPKLSLSTKGLVASKSPKTPQTPKAPKTPKTGSGGKTRGIPIPQSYEEAGEADLTIVRMKREKKPMKDIKAEYERITGTVIANSTISVRINRLLANIERVDPDHIPILRESVKQYQTEKYSRIAEIMEKKGGAKYAAALIQKEISRLEKAKENESSALPSPNSNPFKDEGGNDDADIDENETIPDDENEHVNESAHENGGEAYSGANIIDSIANAE